MNSYRNQREESINNLILIMRNQILNDNNNTFYNADEYRNNIPVLKLSKPKNFKYNKQKRKYFNYIHYTLYYFYNKSN